MDERIAQYSPSIILLTVEASDSEFHSYSGWGSPLACARSCSLPITLSVEVESEEEEEREEREGDGML